MVAATSGDGCADIRRWSATCSDGWRDVRGWVPRCCRGWPRRARGWPRRRARLASMCPMAVSMSLMIVTGFGNDGFDVPDVGLDVPDVGLDIRSWLPRRRPMVTDVRQWLPRPPSMVAAMSSRLAATSPRAVTLSPTVATLSADRGCPRRGAWRIKDLRAWLDPFRDRAATALPSRRSPKAPLDRSLGHLASRPTADARASSSTTSASSSRARGAGRLYLWTRMSVCIHPSTVEPSANARTLKNGGRVSRTSTTVPLGTRPTTGAPSAGPE
jgi:hypothetical protein